jgi:hypothetical protein
MEYTHLLQRWQFKSWYILTYCNVDCFDDGILLTIYNIIDSTRIDATFICLDSVRNVVITKSPERDMIVADHMNQVNLSCEAEGNPSVSFIWFKEPDMNNQLSTEHLLMINDLSANKSGIYACRICHDNLNQ